MEYISYLNEILNRHTEKKVLRWNKSTINVYINTVINGVKHDSDYYFRCLVLRALREWESASNKKIIFKIVDDQKEADINITWPWKTEIKNKPGEVLGTCHYRYSQDSLQKAVIEIYMSEHKPIERFDSLYGVVLHELGHSIGLVSHSLDSNDIMYKSLSKIKHLSYRDKMSLNWLYSFSSGISINEILGMYNQKETANIDELICKLENIYEVPKIIPLTSNYETLISIKPTNMHLLRKEHILAEFYKFDLNFNHLNNNINMWMQ